LTEELFDTLSFINKQSESTPKKSVLPVDMSKSVAISQIEQPKSPEQKKEKAANLDFKIRSHKIVNLTTQSVVIRRNPIGRMLA